MKTDRVEEIAESFINGNISWVRDRVKRKKRFFEVLYRLRWWGRTEEANKFERLYSK